MENNPTRKRSHNDEQRELNLNKTQVKNERKIDILPELDFFSEKYDALNALYKLKEIPTSLPKVKPLDNLRYFLHPNTNCILRSKCRFLLPRDDPNYLTPDIKNTKKKQEEALPESDKLTRGFHYHRRS